MNCLKKKPLSQATDSTNLS